MLLSPVFIVVQPVTRRVGAVLLLSALLSGCVAIADRNPADNANHSAPVATDVPGCADLLSLTGPPTQTMAVSAHSPVELSVAVWNTRKSHGPQWDSELATLTHEHDLVLLQEFVLSDPWQQDSFLSFAPGYLQAETATGVVMLSRTQPLARCELAAMEPVLRTPKATVIAEFPLADGRSLVVVNLHAVNFALGLNNFRLQIAAAASAVAAHQGPLIFTGDFNTWRRDRQLLVQQMLAELNLVPVVFTRDVRKKVFGLALDHMYIRDLEIMEATTQRVKTSDHNPMFVRIRGS